VSPLAAIDCGSNSTRLLIADDDGKTLFREMTITRLSAGVDHDGALTEEAMRRTEACLRDYRRIMDDFGVTTGLVVATSAVRDAANGQHFMDRATAITGLQGRILLGVEEAHLTYGGATEGMEHDGRPIVVVDIGGGSTELVMRLGPDLIAHSMQLGCVRVTERAMGPGPVSPEQLSAADDMISAEWDRLVASAPQFAQFAGSLRMVGVAGTVATLGMLDLGLEEYDRTQLHGLMLMRDSVTFWRIRLQRMTPAERLALAGMVPGREDVIVSGLRILEKVMTSLGVEILTHSESDILDGTISWLRR
jgi:exopolyphosphatase/guanosine-5'-triphosphate,3'-diphosphate pyrophosphatase